MARAIRLSRRRSMRSLWLPAVLATFIFATSPGWAQTVQGGTYEDNGGVLRVEFQSGGKAFMAMGPMSTPCTWKQSGKTVNLACQGDNTDFTVNDDGSLSGPPEGFAAR